MDKKGNVVGVVIVVVVVFAILRYLGLCRQARNFLGHSVLFKESKSIALSYLLTGLLYFITRRRYLSSNGAPLPGLNIGKLQKVCSQMFAGAQEHRGTLI